MSIAMEDALGKLEAARASGAIDPVAMAVIDALARRAALQQGEAQAAMWRRVETLLTLPSTPPSTQQAADDLARPRRGALEGLSELVDRLGRSSAAPGHLKAVTAFKGTWSRLKAEQRLRQALAQVPHQAGPLNSSHVVHHALATMHAVSPEYLDAVMSHIDTLMWLDQASGGDRAIRPGARGEGGRKGPAKSARKG